MINPGLITAANMVKEENDRQEESILKDIPRLQKEWDYDIYIKDGELNVDLKESNYLYNAMLYKNRSAHVKSKISLFKKIKTWLRKFQ